MGGMTCWTGGGVAADRVWVAGTIVGATTGGWETGTGVGVSGCVIIGACEATEEIGVAGV